MRYTKKIEGLVDECPDLSVLVDRINADRISTSNRESMRKFVTLEKQVFPK